MRRQAAADKEFGLAEKIKGLYAAPVLYQKRGAPPKWESVLHGELKDLCQAKNDYKRGSPYFKTLSKVTFSAHVLVPFDIKHDMLPFSCRISSV